MFYSVHNELAERRLYKHERKLAEAKSKFTSALPGFLRLVL